MKSQRIVQNKTAKGSSKNIKYTKIYSRIFSSKRLEAYKIMKKAKCKNFKTCGYTFYQYSTLDNLCYKCKREKYDNKRSPNKIKRILKRKHGRTEEQKAYARCDYNWSQIIKIANPFCWFPDCGEPSTQACHVHSRRHKATRWDIRNGMGGCHKHHRWETDNPKQAKPLVQEFIGAELYEELRKKALETPYLDY